MNVKGWISQHDLWVSERLCCGVICSRVSCLFDIKASLGLESIPLVEVDSGTCNHTIADVGGATVRTENLKQQLEFSFLTHQTCFFNSSPLGWVPSTPFAFHSITWLGPYQDASHQYWPRCSMYGICPYIWFKIMVFMSVDIPWYSSPMEHMDHMSN